LWRELAGPRDDTGEVDPAAPPDETTADARARLIDLLRPPEGAVSDEFDEALYRYSTNGVEFYNMGVARFQKRQWDAAEKAFLKVLELKAAGLERDTRAYLIAVYREKRDTLAAIAQAEVLYRADPSVREPRDLVAGEMDIAKSWDDLEKAARGWVELNPSDPDNWRYLALAQRNLKRPGSTVARSMLNAARAEPASVPAWLAAAEALEEAGDLKAARVAYEKVLELDQKNDRAGQAILRLNLGQLSGPAGQGGPPRGAASGGASMTASPSESVPSPR
jgi:tetratricopeptide (TPR) repeat protein